jgi:hypothetical protein
MRRGGTLGILCGLALSTAGGVAAAPYADLGKAAQCGSYAEASYDKKGYFPGGEAGAIDLIEPQSVRGLNALLFEGVISDEGANEPLGRVMAVRGPLLGADGVLAEEVVVIVTPRGIRVLQPCR